MTILENLAYGPGTLNIWPRSNFMQIILMIVLNDEITKIILHKY